MGETVGVGSREWAEGWRAGAAGLRERGQLSWAVGMALEEALGGERAPVGSEEAALEAIVARVLERCRGCTAEPLRAAVGPSAPSAVARVRRVPPGDAAGLLRQMQTAEVASGSIAAVWFASAGTGSERATLALGLGPEGGKQVLGVWYGGAGEHRGSQEVAGDLRGRGLGRGAAWLAVTGGERALDIALRQQWSGQVVIAHCQERVAREVAGHLPTAARPQATLALSAAWDAPDVESARQALDALAESWRAAHPGAAARLKPEVEPTTTLQALGLRGGLAQRLRTTTPARYLLAQCLPAGRGQTGRAWVAAIGAATWQRQARFRKLPERGALRLLVQALSARRDAEATA